MTTKHTPGPLFVRNIDPNSVQIVDSNGEVVHSEPRCAYSSKHRTAKDAMEARNFDKEWKQQAIDANARQLADMHLRAAGPELLDAVDLVLASFAYAPGEGPEWFEACRKAKAKTEGADYA